MPPNPRPIPQFIADNSQEGVPHGRFAETLAAAFRAACEKVDDLPEDFTAPEEIVWFPERTWGGRVWVPATARAESGAGPIELFGHVSYLQPEEGDPTDLKATADFTDVFAEDNPDWKIDLNDDVIGTWRGEQGMGGDITLIWGRPLIQGAVAATVQIETETVDQDPTYQGRFTLIALDALTGYGDDLFCDVKLWSKRAQELASETLYDVGEDYDEEDDGEATPEGETPKA